MTVDSILAQRRTKVARSVEAILHGRSSEDLSSRVAERVVGQDDAVRGVCRFLVMALRRMGQVTSGTPSSDLPHLSALLVEGPSGCGKTLIVEAACEELGGIPVYTIDGSSITGTGWAGGDIEAHKYRLAEMQGKGPATPIVVFIDEADKLSKGGDRPRDGFDPCESILRLVEGDDVEMVDAPSRSGKEGAVPLDKASLVFVFAGAFTGLDEIVRSRLARESGGPGAGFSAGGSISVASLDESELRLRSSPDDLISWGLPRELVGRITSLVRVRPLGQEDLVEVIRGAGDSVESRFSTLMPWGCSFSIDESAANFVAEAEVSSGRGARGVEAALTPISCEAVEVAVTDLAVTGVTVTLGDQGLELSVEREEEPVRAQQEEDATHPGDVGGRSSAAPRSSFVSDAPRGEGEWTPPSWTESSQDDLAHVAVRLRLASGPGAADPVATVRAVEDARRISRAIVDEALSDLPPRDARVAFELVYGALVYALHWGGPGDVKADVLCMLVDEAAKGVLFNRVFELWDGRSRGHAGEASHLRHGLCVPAMETTHGKLTYRGIEPGDDSALRHILFFRALAGKRCRKIAGEVSRRISTLRGGAPRG